MSINMIFLFWILFILWKWRYSKTNLAKSSNHNQMISMNLVIPSLSKRWWCDADFLSLLCSPGGAVCSIVCATDADVSQCASSAVNGFKAWSDLTCHQRGKALLKYNKLSLTHVKTFGTDRFCNWPNGQMTGCVTLPLPTGWWAYSDSTGSAYQSCLSCVGPPALHLPW